MITLKSIMFVLYDIGSYEKLFYETDVTWTKTNQHNTSDYIPF